MTANVAGLGAAHIWTAESGAGMDRAHGATGEWNGLAVAVAHDPSSLIADAMEEMTFAAEETAEKEVSERKTEKPKEKRINQVVPPTEAVTHLRQQMAERLAKLLQAVKAAMGNPARFREAIAEFSDPTERHVALAWLEEQLADMPSMRELATRERERLEAEEAQAIQAGYNIVGVDADGAGGPAAGRAEYRRTILGHAQIGTMLENILERHGEDDFGGTVEFLRQAVSADLSAAHPSTDKRELEALNNDLYHLRSLANFTREFGEGMGRLRTETQKPPLERAGLEVMRLFCKAKEERLVMLDPIKVILHLEGERDPTYDVRALSQAQQLAHKLPAKLFPDEDARQRLLAAGQKLLDEAINLEETILSEDG